MHAFRASVFFSRYERFYIRAKTILARDFPSLHRRFAHPVMHICVLQVYIAHADYMWFGAVYANYFMLIHSEFPQVTLGCGRVGSLLQCFHFCEQVFVRCV